MSSKGDRRLPPMIHWCSGSLEKLGCGQRYSGATAFLISCWKSERSYAESLTASDRQLRLYRPGGDFLADGRTFGCFGLFPLCE